ncbi:MAG TPA: N-acetyltransferase, partial [Ramlibacter sp.]
GDGFLARVGAECRWRTVDSRLQVEEVDAGRLQRMVAVADADPALRWEVHAGRVPWETLAGLMEPFTTFINDQPLEGLDMPRMHYRLEGFHTWYAEMDERGGDHFVVLLRAGEEVVAMSEASWDARTPDRLYQKLTAVNPAWRGRGLAGGVKARLVLLVRARRPQVRTVVTYNARSNAPMLAVNRNLGFRVYREEATWQLRREALEDYVVRARRLG